MLGRIRLKFSKTAVRPYVNTGLGRTKVDPDLQSYIQCTFQSDIVSVTLIMKLRGNKARHNENYPD